jgi:hypothetical protein
MCSEFAEMTPIQSWFLLYGDAVPPVEVANATFEEVFLEKLDRLSQEALESRQDGEIDDDKAIEVIDFVTASLEAAAADKDVPSGAILQAGLKLAITALSLQLGE